LRKAGAQPFVNELFGYNIYHKFNAGVFEKIDFTTDTTFTHVSPDPGAHTYYVTSVYSNGESGPSNEHTVDVLTGIPEHAGELTQIYPNPARDKVCIETEENLERVQLINISGQIVVDQFVSGNKTQINTVDFLKGIYFIKVFSHNYVITKKLVIE
jgi:hypothetical protein